MLWGGERPRAAVERIAFAELLHAKSCHAQSARMWEQAFAEDASLAEDLAKSHRDNAACSAALAAAHGADAAQCRGRALEWLRADLAARERAATGLVATLEHWKHDPDLASVRDRPGDLPESERAAWQGLWAAVDAALATARFFSPAHGTLRCPTSHWWVSATLTRIGNRWPRLPCLSGAPR